MRSVWKTLDSCRLYLWDNVRSDVFVVYRSLSWEHPSLGMSTTWSRRLRRAQVLERLPCRCLHDTMGTTGLVGVVCNCYILGVNKVEGHKQSWVPKSGSSSHLVSLDPLHILHAAKVPKSSHVLSGWTKVQVRVLWMVVHILCRPICWWC